MRLPSPPLDRHLPFTCVFKRFVEVDDTNVKVATLFRTCHDGVVVAKFEVAVFEVSVGVDGDHRIDNVTPVDGQG